MQTGFIGLGKMGGNMVKRLLQHGQEVVAFDLSPEAVDAAVAAGAGRAASLQELCGTLAAPRVIWMMVPAGRIVDTTITELLPHLAAGDILVDGGNSNWKDSRRRAEALKEKSITLIDCGTSGGVWGLTEGYCLMYGGDEKACRTLEPLFTALAPAGGHLRCGDAGAGHYVKMIHNGIEYGMMQAYAEGFELLRKSPFTPDLTAVAGVWRQGSVVRSWLLDLLHRALEESPDLEGIKPRVEDSGEGRWSVDAAVEQAVPAPVITAALFARFQSRETDSFAMKLLAALRNQFGGHAVSKD